MQATTIPTAPRLLLRRKTAAERLGLTLSTFYRNQQAGLIPGPIRLPGGATSAWVSDEIEAVQRAIIAGKSDDELRALVAALTEARAAGEVAA